MSWHRRVAPLAPAPAQHSHRWIRWPWATDPSRIGLGEAAWRPLPERRTAEAVFCFHDPRRVANDATISWPGDDLALPRRRDGRRWTGGPVVVQERLDGSRWVGHEGELHPLRPAPPDAGQLRARRLAAPSGATLPPEVVDLAEAEKSTPLEHPPAAPWRPRRDHPWRRYRDRDRRQCVGRRQGLAATDPRVGTEHGCHPQMHFGDELLVD